MLCFHLRLPARRYHPVAYPEQTESGSRLSYLFVLELLPEELFVPDVPLLEPLLPDVLLLEELLLPDVLLLEELFPLLEELLDVPLLPEFFFVELLLLEELLLFCVDCVVDFVEPPELVLEPPQAPIANARTPIPHNTKPFFSNFLNFILISFFLFCISKTLCF